MKQKFSLSELDCQILNLIQEDFPLTKRPFQEIAKKLGSTEEEVFARVHQLKDCGIIRKLGASFDSSRLGYTSTLVAMRVAEEKMDQTAEIINSYPQVTHNYARDHYYNLWFTIIAQNQGEIERILAEIGQKTGVEEIYSLPALRIFKLRPCFNF